MALPTISGVPPDLRPALPKRRYWTYKNQVPLDTSAPHSTRGFDPGHGYYVKPPVTRVPVHKPVAGSPFGPDFASAQAQASALLDPVLRSTTEALNRRGADMQSALGGYTDTLAQLFGKYGTQSKAGFDQAKLEQSAVDATLGAALHGDAGAAQTDLAGKLDGLGNADYASKLTADLGNAYKGAEGVQAATGANTLGMLINQGANAQDYGAKLPGVAGLFGLSATKGLQKDINHSLADAITQIESKRPDLVQSIVAQKQTNRNQQKQIRTELAMSVVQQTGEVPKWAASILGVPPGTLTPSARATIASVTGTDPVTGDPTPTTVRTQQAGADKTAKDAQAKEAKAGDKALKIIQGAVSGGTKLVPKTNAFGEIIKGPDGKPVMTSTKTSTPAVGYYDAIKRIKAAVQADLRVAGYSDAQITQFAQQYANAYYPAGKYGRPGGAASSPVVSATDPFGGPH
jgi:hypothetical protein